MRFLYFLSIIIFSQFRVFHAFGQDIKISLGKNTITLNEEFSILLTFSKNEKAAFKTFHYSAFPEIYDMVKVKTFYSEDKEAKVYKILQTYKPLKLGVFKLDPFKFKINGEDIHSQGTTIKVNPLLNKKEKIEPEIQKLITQEETYDIMLSFTSDKKEVFSGEGFTVTLALYIGENNTTKFNFINLYEQALKWKINPSNCLTDKSSPGIIEKPVFDTISIKDKLYKRLKLFQARFYPINTEPVKFSPLAFSLIKYQIAKTTNTFLWKAEETSLNSQALNITVKDLPAHQLKDKIAVGNFQLKEAISSTKLKTGTSFQYVFSIIGDGNMAIADAPKIKENDNFDFYSPEVREYVSMKSGKYLTTKTYQYNILPNEPGLFKMEDYFQWIYFNPTKKEYDTLRSRIPLNVTGESQKNKYISSSDPGSFYKDMDKESNKLKNEEKDESIIFFANIIILFMLVTTAILILKR
jgi:hypothetical protein